MASANFSMSAQIEESGVSGTPSNALASSDYALSSTQRGDSTQLKYTEAELDRIIENEESQEREKVHLEYAERLSTVRQELAQVKCMNEEGKGVEDEQMVLEQNFESDSCLTEHQLHTYRNLLSEYDEFEKEITDQHAVLQLQSSKADDVHKSQTQSSLQSLSSSFEDLQQRYKQLKEDCANKIKSQKEALQVASKLEKMNQQLQFKVQSDFEVTNHEINEANVQYSSIQKRLMSELTVERAAAKKAQVEVTRLEKSLKQLAQEKSQLSQICEDLMKEVRRQ